MFTKIVGILFLLVIAGACAQSGYNRPYMISDSIPEEVVVESIDQR